MLTFFIFAFLLQAVTADLMLNSAIKRDFSLGLVHQSFSLESFRTYDVPNCCTKLKIDWRLINSWKIFWARVLSNCDAYSNKRFKSVLNVRNKIITKFSVNFQLMCMCQTLCHFWFHSIKLLVSDLENWWYKNCSTMSKITY